MGMILGTLFERGLDPDKRAQFGAHYTDRDKIPAEFLTHVSPLGWEHINLTGEIPLARHGTRRATRNACVGCSPPPQATVFSRRVLEVWRIPWGIGKRVYAQF